ncbi:hypothetical protein BH10ACT7_BH10ACT7_20070 [soil metagenome]
MFASLALASLAAAPDGPWAGHWGFGFLFLLIPLFWIGLFVLFASIARRRWSRGGWGPGYAYGHHGHGGWAAAAAARNAESTLAERFAQGDIDEKEYRARLEVLRANNTFTPPAAK